MPRTGATFRSDLPRGFRRHLSGLGRWQPRLQLLET